MKICYIFSNFHQTKLTGQAGIMFKLIQKAKARYQKVLVISNSNDDKSYQGQNLKALLLKGDDDAKAFLFSTFRLIKFLKHEKPDIVHVNGALMTIYFSLLNIFLRLPTVCLLTEVLDNIHPLLRSLYIWCLKKTQYLFITSIYMEKMLIKMGVLKSQISVVRLGLDPQFLSIQQPINEPVDIIFFGDNNRDRGFDHIYSLAKQLPQHSFQILLRYKQNDCLPELAKMEHFPNVSIQQYPYQEPLELKLSKAKLIVLPFRWMLIRPPISIVEAMALGKCVITSTMKGNEEIITDGVNGILVDPSDTKTVISRINFLLTDDPQRNKIGINARRQIEKLYNREEYDKIFRIYSLINRKT